MSKESNFLIYCMERYRYFKGLSGADVAKKFEKYDIYGYIIKYFVYQKTDSAKLLYGILPNFAMSKMLFFVKIKFAIEKALDKKRNMIK